MWPRWHNGGCDRAGRVYNGHIMVATIETTSELGLRRAARGCRVVAGGHQTGTGVAAGEVGYSGATAQFRCLGTGFRAADGTNSFGLSPNALNSNRVNLHEYVVAMAAVDPAGALRTGPPRAPGALGVMAGRHPTDAGMDGST